MGVLRAWFLPECKIAGTSYISSCHNCATTCDAYCENISKVHLHLLLLLMPPLHFNSPSTLLDIHMPLCEPKGSYKIVIKTKKNVLYFLNYLSRLEYEPLLVLILKVKPISCKTKQWTGKELQALLSLAKPLHQCIKSPEV